MDEKQAWELLVNAIPQLNTTLQNHQLLQKALMVLKPKEHKVEKETDE